ncbi:MAG: Ig family protein [Candidatus Solibacter sp.]|nr:Ig family protein [Candidatus Solibacter sp.]
MRGNALKRWFVVATLATGVSWAAPTISSLNASQINSAQPSPAVTGITSGTPINAFDLYVNGTFNADVNNTITWFDGQTTTTLAPDFASTTQLRFPIPAPLFSAVVSFPVPITITVIENGSVPSNPATFFVNPPPSPVSLSFVGTVGQPFSLTVITGGTPPYNIVPGSLPPTFSMSAGPTGVLLTGQPATPGVFSISPQVTDFWGSQTSPALTLQIVANAVLNSLIPVSAPAGSPDLTLIVNGANFVAAQPAQELAGSQVLWKFGSSTTPLPTTFINGNQLQAVVSSDMLTTPGLASVVVVQPNDINSPPLTFTILAPAIISLSPPNIAAGSPGFTLAVNGANFLSQSSIVWNGTPLTTTFSNSGLLAAQVPAGLLTAAGAFPVQVLNPGGATSNAVNFLVNPTITGLTPPSVGGGSATFTLTVTGTQFIPTSIVSFNGSPLNTSFVSANALTAIVPSTQLTVAGLFPVTVTNPGGGTSAPANFVILPAITTLTPASAAAGSPQFTLTVRGATFTVNSTVSFNGTPLNTTFSNSGQLTAIVPATLLTAAGAFPVIVTTPNLGASAPVNFIVNPTITNLSPSSVPAGSAAFTLSVTGATFVAQSVVSLNGANLQTTFVNTGLVTAQVPANLVTTAGTYPVVVTNPNNNASAPVNFTVSTSLSIATTSLGLGAAGAQYSATVVGRGGTPPYNWSATGLPASLAINASTGVISGVALQGGTFGVTVFLKDSVGATASAQYSLSIGPPPVSISTGGLPNGTVGVPYVGIIGASGGNGPYNFSLSGGKLPNGLSLNGGGTVSGTPQTPGTFNFSVGVTDSSGGSAGRDYSVTIAPAPLVVTGAPPTGGGTSGVALTIVFGGSGGVGPYRCSVSGTLPPGLTFSNCTLSGTPTTPGTYTFRVTITDSTGASTTKDVTITIAPPGLTLSGTLANGQVGAAYSGQLIASGGVPPYTYSASGLPDGLSVSSSGAITGTPTTEGPYSISASVSDSTGSKANATLRLTIAAADLAVTTASLPDGTVNSAYSASLGASGGVKPYTWSASGLPDGLSITAAGAVSGTPTAAGKFTVSVTVKDAAGASAVQRFSVTIAAPAITITSTALAGGTVGASYSATLGATGGVAPFTWSASGLPAGLTISAGGTISGTPAAFGSFTVTATVKDSLGTSVSKTFPLSVALPPAPPLNFNGISNTSPPVQQPNLQVSLGTVYPVDVVATLTLTFAADSGPDDPTIQFSTGGRTARITIPAGATLGANTVGVQTGSVAGLITIAAQLQAAGTDVTPAPAPRFTIRIAALAPVPTTVTATRNSTGFTVTVIGYVTTREITQVIFTFNAAPGTNLQTTSLTIPVDTLFSAYFSGSGATPFGGQFSFTQPFTVNGGSSAIVSVTITMVNKIGQSTAVTVTLN